MTIYALDKLSADPVTLSRFWADRSTLWVNAEDVTLSLGKPSKIGTWRLDPVTKLEDPFVRYLQREIEDDIAAIKSGKLKSRGGRRLDGIEEREAAMNAGLAIRALERAADGSSETVTLILRKSDGYAYRQTPVGFITFRRSTTSLLGRSAVSVTFAVDHVYVTPRNRGRGFADAMLSAVYSTFHNDVETIAAAASRGAIAIGACIAWTSPEPVFGGLLADLVDAFSSSYEATGSYDVGSCFVTFLEPVVTAPRSRAAAKPLPYPRRTSSMAPRMNMSREAVVRFVDRWNKRRDVSAYPTAGDIAHGLGFETLDRARTHIRYTEWAKWIERAEPQGRALTYRVTDAGRAAIGTVLEPAVTAS